jgi:rhombotail lipoprotein
MTANTRVLICLIAITLCLQGCSSFWGLYSGQSRRGVSSSLVDYLYPDGEVPPAHSEVIPQLNLPLRVGLAFVPSRYESHLPALSETAKAQLLENVRANFLDRNYISHIEIIPDTYLRGSRGFTGLEQLGRLYQLDSIALVSYDQVVSSEDTTASFLYWTIIGAYVIKGSQNEVQTFVDTAVFDIPTRRLLFRAPGLDKDSSKSTLIGLPEEVREARTASFERAMANMTTNLAAELDRFEQRTREDQSVATVSGGSTGLLFFLGLASCALLRRLGRKNLLEEC